MQPDPEQPEVVLGLDLIAPEGYGEIIGGSQRIHDHDLLLAAHPASTTCRSRPSSGTSTCASTAALPARGFGMGIERCTAWMAGLPHLRETIPFPRLYEWCRP